MIYLGLFIHFLLVFGTIFLLQIMMNKRKIDDIGNIILVVFSIFVPFVILIVLGAKWLGDYVS